MQKTQRNIRILISLFCIWGIFGTLFFYLSENIDQKLSAKEIQLLVEMSTDAKQGNIKVFWDRGSGFSEQNSQSAKLEHSSSSGSYHFSLPNTDIETLRIDPVESDERAFISTVSLQFGHALGPRIVSLDDAVANDNIEFFNVTEKGLEIVPIKGSNDPFIVIPFTLNEYAPTFLSWGNLFFLVGMTLVFMFSILFLVFQKKVAGICEKTPTRGVGKTVIFALFLFLVASLVYQLTAIFKPDPKIQLDVIFHEPVEGSIQFFWAFQKPAFRPSNSKLIRLKQNYRSFSIESGIPSEVKWLRVDFPDAANTFTLESLFFSFAWWSEETLFSESDIVSLNDLKIVNDPHDSSFLFQVTGPDPYFVWQLPE